MIYADVSMELSNHQMHASPFQIRSKYAHAAVSFQDLLAIIAVSHKLKKTFQKPNKLTFESKKTDN